MVVEVEDADGCCAGLRSGSVVMRIVYKGCEMKVVEEGICISNENRRGVEGR